MPRIAIALAFVATFLVLPSTAAAARRADADARHCLAKASNYAVIKCAEPYLSRQAARPPSSRP